jgi:glycosyltransferase involved in cell wall biosynthesis
MESWLGVPRNMAIAAPRPQEVASLQAKMHVVIVPNTFSMEARWLAILRKVREQRPQAVIFVGLVSPLISLLYREFPLVGLATNTGLTIVGPQDVALVADGRHDHDPWTQIAPPAQTVAHTRRFRIQLSEAGPSRRIEQRIPEDAILWLTSGTRLHEEMSPQWSTRVLEILQATPQAHWLIVGLSPERQRTLGLVHERLHLLHFDEELSSWMRDSDIYLAPRRFGGGTSMCMAMAHGLAVVASQVGDAGHKLGNFALADDDACMIQLARLSQDSMARQNMGFKLRARYQEEFEARESDDGLEQAIALARDFAEKRLAGDTGGS